MPSDGVLGHRIDQTANGSAAREKFEEIEFPIAMFGGVGLIVISQLLLYSARSKKEVEQETD